MKKMQSLLMAAVLLLSVFASALIATPAKAAVNQTKTVTLHKLLMDKDAMANFITPADYDGTQDRNQLQGMTSTQIQEIPDVYFAWQNEAGKWIDQQGQEVATLDQAYGMLTGANGAKFDTSAFPEGKYKIVEVRSKTTYAGDAGELLAASKAVPVEISLPMINSKGYVTDAHVYPKNTQEKPSITKTVTDTTAKKLGDDVPYQVKTTFNAGTHYQTLSWNDTMSDGLTMNQDVAIQADNGISFVANDDYQLLQDKRGFSLRLTDAGIKKIESITAPTTGAVGQDVTVTLTYTAQVNAKAFTSVTNNVTLNYSNSSSTISAPVPVTPTPTSDLAVTKSWTDAAGTTIPTPADVELVYSLVDGTTPVASVVLKSDGANQVIDLGNGITFETTGNGSGTFKGLPAATTGYTIFERVTGYTPAYAATTGGVTITNKKLDTPDKIVSQNTSIELNGKRFVKTDKQTADRLASAQFLVKKGNDYLAYKPSATRGSDLTAMNAAKKALDDAIAAYNKMSSAEQKAQAGQDLKASFPGLQKSYDDALKSANIAYTTTTDKTDANIVKLTSNAQGQFELAGLEAGDYQLEEVVAPKGYALLTTPVNLTVGGATATANTIEYVAGSGTVDAIRVDNVTLSIPQTGGVGTILFVVTGAAIMAAAAYFFVKNNKKEEIV